jgi:hypothetical protein
MSRLIVALLLSSVASPALAQEVSTSGPTRAELDALAAQIPQPSSSVPSADMATAGQLGSSARYRRVDDQAPRISRTVSGTTDATGSGAVSWPAMPSAPKLTVTPYVSSTETLPPACYPVLGTVTTTGATIRCYKSQSLLGLGVLPFTVAPSGVQFDVLALPGS